jgi:hypothetical protein
MEWPDYGDEPLEQRVRRAARSDDLDILLLKAPQTTPDEHASNYPAAIYTSLGPAFEQEVMERREHLERMGIRGLNLTLTVIQRATGRRGWTDTVHVTSLPALNVTSRRVDKLMAARALSLDRDRLLSARLRLPDGIELTRRQGGADDPPIVAARFPEGSLAAPIDMSPDLLGAVTSVHEAQDVRAGLRRFADAYGAPFDEALDQLMPVVEHALRQGLLEVD